jgi:hypothetical protein
LYTLEILLVLPEHLVVVTEELLRVLMLRYDEMESDEFAYAELLVVHGHLLEEYPEVLWLR